MSEIPDLLPPRDRRRAKRWITTKSVLVTASAVVFLLLTWSVVEKAMHSSSNTLGRLSVSRKKTEKLVPQAPLTSSPTPIVEGESPDALSVDAARREQMLGVAPRPVAPPATADPAVALDSETASTAEVESRSPMLNQLKPGQTISITGGADGVKVNVTSTARPPAPPS